MYQLYMATKHHVHVESYTYDVSTGIEHLLCRFFHLKDDVLSLSQQCLLLPVLMIL